MNVILENSLGQGKDEKSVNLSLLTVRMDYEWYEQGFKGGPKLNPPYLPLTDLQMPLWLLQQHNKKVMVAFCTDM